MYRRLQIMGACARCSSTPGPRLEAQYSDTYVHGCVPEGPHTYPPSPPSTPSLMRSLVWRTRRFYRICGLGLERHCWGFRPPSCNSPCLFPPTRSPPLWGTRRVGSGVTTGYYSWQALRYGLALVAQTIATLLSRYYRWSEGIRHATTRYVLGAYFLFIELYVFPFAGNLTVAWSRVRRGGRYVTGQTRVGPGARRWAGFGIVIRARDRGRRSAGAAVT